MEHELIINRSPMDIIILFLKHILFNITIPHEEISNKYATTFKEVTFFNSFYCLIYRINFLHTIYPPNNQDLIWKILPQFGHSCPIFFYDLSGLNFHLHFLILFGLCRFNKACYRGTTEYYNAGYCSEVWIMTLPETVWPGTDR
jgi:hypothetical protein